MSLSEKRLLVVSNRLPVVISRNDDRYEIEPGSGGLVTALAPLMRQNRGVWVGWPGCGPEVPAETLLSAHSSDRDYELKPVNLTDDDVGKFYRGFCNRTIWPLFHDLLGYCVFDLNEWLRYVDVNRRFADTVAAQIESDSFVWVHDYQLMLVGHFLRDMGVKRHIGFFLHIPFPSRDLFRRFPWKMELLQCLLEYDHLGFQTLRDRRNFIQCVRDLLPEATMRTSRRESRVICDNRTVRLGAYPISIDFDEFSEGARSSEVADAAWFLHENIPGRTLVLGLDRLDYTKGIPERFKAFERMLEKYPDVHGNISLVQIVIPSRLLVPDYQELKESLDALAGSINSRFSQHGWIPIHYVFRALDRIQLLGHYRACEIALITPLRDGMNLVSKEYCASSIDNNGVLILSEFAGAAEQMSKAALMVNPYDIEGTADAIYQAYIMDPEERRKRMKVLRSEVRRNNVHKWIDLVLGNPTHVRSQAPSPTVAAR
ncbi:MAG: trehalose-6-phosphate synthase [bacterium]